MKATLPRFSAPAVLLLALGALAGAPDALAAQEQEEPSSDTAAADPCYIPGPPHPNMSEQDRKLLEKARGTSSIETVTVDGRKIPMARVGSSRFARWNCQHDLELVVELRRNGENIKLETYGYSDEYSVSRWRLWIQQDIGPTSGDG